jgi:hypothetical protein
VDVGAEGGEEGEQVFACHGAGGGAEVLANGLGRRGGRAEGVGGFCLPALPQEEDQELGKEEEAVVVLDGRLEKGPVTAG